MHIHILGICGTFMGGIAQLARAAGHTVSGQDANVYPPMSTQLEQAGIELTEGYAAAAIPPHTDCVVIGNALSRGNEAVEQVLNSGMAYTSGPQWLAEHILQSRGPGDPGRWVLGVAGTHGKTSTSSMLAWILDYAGLAPGFLIGGVPQNFGVSARLGENPFFVVEADEYDSAFFDKRSKFVHYRPRTLVVSNLEFDHADIFADLGAIQTQFHHLLRTVPGQGRVIRPQREPAVDAVFERGCWSETESFAIEAGEGGWQARLESPDGQRFAVLWNATPQGTLSWGLIGRHNVSNALAAIAAARHAGVAPGVAIEALGAFEGVKRRLELRGTVRGVAVYDDFAHHPTAIASTLQGLRKRVGEARIIALLEPRSNTMRMGVHQGRLGPALAEADRVMFYAPPDLGWSLEAEAALLGGKAEVYKELEALVAALDSEARSGDHVLVMSNGAFGGIHERLLAVLAQASQQARA